MSYLSKDEQILIKISKHLNKLNTLYSSIVNLTDTEIDDGIEGLALTQCITNLFELSSRIDNDDVLERLSMLSSGRVARVRNIASHDYDSINWSIIKNICRKILSSITIDVINELLDDINKSKKVNKQYNQ